MAGRLVGGTTVAVDEGFITGCNLPATVWRFLPGRGDHAEIAEGLRDWLLLGGWAMQEDVAVGMPSWLVDEAWHGFILDTSRYADFCQRAYAGRFLHHFPPGALPASASELTDVELVRRGRELWDRRADGRTPTLFGLDGRLGRRARLVLTRLATRGRSAAAAASAAAASAAPPAATVRAAAGVTASVVAAAAVEPPEAVARAAARRPGGRPDVRTSAAPRAAARRRHERPDADRDDSEDEEH